MLIGAIADDLTGATDLALTLSRGGMQTVQTIGLPPTDFEFASADAVVVALKSRTIPAEQAVSQSLAAAELLLAGGARQIFFKYCSTFDSTTQGNIGPVIEALLDLLDLPLTVSCPAFPDNGRTVYQGHLFVGEQLLSESAMKDHPLTPMTDANLVRLLQQQTRLPVGLVPHQTVRQGTAALARAFSDATARGQRIVIVDALSNDDLISIGNATSMKLLTGASGLALGLPECLRGAGLLHHGEAGRDFNLPSGRSVMLAGSCSAATRRQVAAAIEAGIPAMRIDPLSIRDGRVSDDDAVSWVIASGHPTPLIYSSGDPDAVRFAQQQMGTAEAGEAVEQFLASVARRLGSHGYTRFVIAGGETSGAVVHSLDIGGLQIGPEIDPGVPWTVSTGSERRVAVALKSGNFGRDDFFVRAWSMVH